MMTSRGDACDRKGDGYAKGMLELKKNTNPSGLHWGGTGTQMKGLQQKRNEKKNVMNPLNRGQIYHG